ncbi:DUF3500 domain-containing protein [Fulvivirgaceae bacterium BMA10]|uniref:DUF3500 domain-containing protein n=1 Tax=Splendidivirga corallicola TaxID=3051826 RepID=A0ABT8KRP3_9BACT|nr:DUF3500 domain-containing protein [Fulvivirgaceae bacterium BMA10]
MKASLIPASILLTVLTSIQYTFPDQKKIQASHGSHGMVEAAQQFLTSLEDNQKKKAYFNFKEEERYNWHFIPKTRKGLSFEEMDPTQRKKLTELLRTGLSAKGYDKARAIMNLELVLREIEGRGDNDRRRHPELYYLAIFGSPSNETPWGWRFEGHHLSLNFTFVKGEASVTPAFIGANPAKVRSGKWKGTQVLKEEEDLARALINTLTTDQRKKAIFDVKAPQDIITGVARKAELKKMSGLPLSDMNSSQKELLLQLLNVYLGNIEEDIALKRLKSIKDHNIALLHFAWAGSTEVGKPHYYRIHGPSILIEYDNTQNDANHIHTVFRDYENDFGEDLLHKHYKEHDHD